MELAKEIILQALSIHWTQKRIVEIRHVEPKHSTGELTTEMLIYTNA